MADETTATGGQEAVSESGTQTLAEAVNNAATSEGTGEETDETASQSAGEGEGDNEQEHADKPKGKGGFQKRIEKLSRKIEQAEQEKEYWRQQALRTQSDKPKDNASGEATDPEPDPKDFDTLESYLKAARAWDRKQATQAALKEFEQRSKVEKEKSERQTVADTWNKKVEAARSEHDDYDEALESASVPVTPALAEALLQCEQGGHVAYYLAKHEEEALAISKMSPMAAAVALGKIEARIAGEKPVEKKAPPVTKAPKPVSPVSKTSTSAITDPLEAAVKGDFALYEKLMAKREAKKSG